MALRQEFHVPSLNSLQIRITKLPTFEATVRNKSNVSLTRTLKMVLLEEKVNACKLKIYCKI